MSSSDSSSRGFWKHIINNPKSLSTESLVNVDSFGKRKTSDTLLTRPTISSKTGKKIVPMGKQTVLSDAEFKNYRDEFFNERNNFTGSIFGVSLTETLKLASAEVILQNAFVKFGHIPIVVAKCGAYLKSNALETPGIFRIAGNTRRVKELQHIFSTPPKYGSKFQDWEKYTVHDVSSLLRRFLNNLQEPLIPISLYDQFRKPIQDWPRVKEFIEIYAENKYSKKNKEDISKDAAEGDEIDGNRAEALNKKKEKKKLAKEVKEVIHEYKQLFLELCDNNRQLIIYLLDLLRLFARQSETNLMTSRNLSAIFQPSILSHPQHDMKPEEYEISRLVVQFLITYTYKLLPFLLNLSKDDKQKIDFMAKVDQNSLPENEKKTVIPKIKVNNESEITDAISPAPLDKDAASLHSMNEPNQPSLQVPKLRRPHSKSIGSAPMTIDSSINSKRKSRVFQWLHISNPSSDSSDDENDEPFQNHSSEKTSRAPSEDYRYTASPRNSFQTSRHTSNTTTIYDADQNKLVPKTNAYELSTQSAVARNEEHTSTASNHLSPKLSPTKEHDKELHRKNRNSWFQILGKKPRSTTET